MPVTPIVLLLSVAVLGISPVKTNNISEKRLHDYINKCVDPALSQWIDGEWPKESRARYNFLRRKIILLGPPIKPALIHIVKSNTDFATQDFAICLVGDMHVVEAVPALIGCMEGAPKGGNIVYDAAVALSKINTPSSVKALLSEICGPHGGEIQNDDDHLILRADNPELIPVFEDFLRTSEEKAVQGGARSWACSIVYKRLAKMGTSESVAVLGRELERNDLELWGEVANALGGAKARNEAAKLLKKSFNRNEGNDRQILLAGNILRQERWEPALDLLRKTAFSRSLSSQDRRSAVNLMEDINIHEIPEAGSILRELLFDEDEDVRDEACDVLVDIGDERDLRLAGLVKEYWKEDSESTEQFLEKARERRADKREREKEDGKLIP